ncbi:MAG TPA: hypothetical protein GXX37_01735 [Clostridiaceae bacterium]|nr:hypothetical protein [Clostridiaceae bacterium]
MKRYLMLILVLILTLSILAGCVQSGTNQSQQSTQSAQSQNQQDVGVKSNEKAPPTVLSMMIESHASWPYNPDWYVFKLIEEELNIKFDVTTVIGGNYDEK